jgi:hypothetical protein
LAISYIFTHTYTERGEWERKREREREKERGEWERKRERDREKERERERRRERGREEGRGRRRGREEGRGRVRESESESERNVILTSFLKKRIHGYYHANFSLSFYLSLSLLLFFPKIGIIYSTEICGSQLFKHHGKACSPL